MKHKEICKSNFTLGVFGITELDLCFVQTAEALAEQVSQENLDKGLIYPPFSNIRKISARIAARVAAKAYELGKYLYSANTF